MLSKEQKKVLITGSSGFIGSNLKNFLISAGHKVIGVGRGLGEDFSIDLLDPKLKDIIKDFSPDIICHLASGSNIARANEDKDKEFNDTVFATQNLLEIIKSLNIDLKIVYLSSQAVYGYSEELPVNESHICKPITIYGENKLKAEEAITNSGLNYVIFRVSSIYGPKQDYNKSGVIAKFINKMKNNEAPVVFNSFDIFSDFIFVNDVVSAIARSIDNDLAQKDIFNLGSGIPTTLNELLDLLYKYFPDAPKAELQLNLLYMNKEQKGLYLDIEKIKSRLNWLCKYDLSKGLREILDPISLLEKK